MKCHADYRKELRGFLWPGLARESVVPPVGGSSPWSQQPHPRVYRDQCEGSEDHLNRSCSQVAAAWQPVSHALVTTFKGRCWSKICFANFSTHSFHLTVIMISMRKYGEIKKKKFPRFISMGMVAIFDFRALAKVHITLKPLLQMQ